MTKALTIWKTPSIILSPPSSNSRRRRRRRIESHIIRMETRSPAERAHGRMMPSKSTTTTTRMMSISLVIVWTMMSTVLMATPTLSFFPLGPLKNTPTSLSPSSTLEVHQQHRRWLTFGAFPPARQRPSSLNTQLYAQKKRPRFTQQVHTKKSSSTSSSSSSFRPGPSSRPGEQRKGGEPVHGQVWKSGKTIEELEGIMSNRWGSMADGTIVRPGDTRVGDDDDDAGGKRRWVSGKADVEIDFGTEDDEYEYHEVDDDDNEAVNRWRRPVIDPWDEEEERIYDKNKNNAGKLDETTNGKSQTRRTPIPAVQEYYDQDDKGYETILEANGDDPSGRPLSLSSSSVLKVDHLIAPEPAAGGRKSSPSICINKCRSRNVGSSSEGSYFFNPNALSVPPSTSSNKSSPQSETRNGQPTITPANSEEEALTSSLHSIVQPPPPPTAKPLVDENGRPLLLTVDEAFRRFRDTVDAETMERIDASDIPILASSDKVDARELKPPSWSDLGVTSPVLLENLDYTNCLTPLSVQEKTTPAVLTGNDVLVGTYTGSGKTLAFLVPLIQRMLWNRENRLDGDTSNLGVAVLIVAPGRELASQIVSVARELLQDTGLISQLAIGGTTFARNLEQIRKRKPNIVVGTPGRIAELIVGKPGEKSGKLKIGSLQSLVLDEFDALLEYKPHRDPTRAIMQSLKRRHGDSLQSILCSATATDIMETSKVVEFLRPSYDIALADDDDVLVSSVGGDGKRAATQVSRTILHGVLHLSHRRLALDAVRKILHTEPIPQQILVFVDNARKVDIVVEKLADRGIIAAPLHGGTPGGDSNSNKMDRAEVSKALREGYVGIVVATELAARGLDAPLLTHVINLDLPTDASHYAHRAGRCGRGGRPGVVINITTSPKEQKVPQRFAEALGVDMHPIEPRSGKLFMLDESSG